MAKRITAYVGLGSNVGESQATLDAAVRALAALPGVQLEAVSPVYRTKPVGMRDQPDFLNGVAALEVPAGPDPESGALALLTALKQIEAALGRQPGQRWGPREIDLDLLLFGDFEIDAKRPDGRWLRVPHPEMEQRLFVLAPLADLVPDLQPPGWRETVAVIRQRRRALEGPESVRPMHWSPSSPALGRTTCPGPSRQLRRPGR